MQVPRQDIVNVSVYYRHIVLYKIRYYCSPFRCCDLLYIEVWYHV